MKYEVDNKKLEEGMHEMMKNRFNKLEKISNQIDKKISKLKNLRSKGMMSHDTINHEKSQLIIQTKDCMHLAYDNYENVASGYISIKDYNKKFREIVQEKINYINNELN